MLKKIKYAVVAILISGFFSSFAYANTLCTFEIVNDVPQIFNGHPPTFYLTHVVGSEDFRFHWTTSTLMPNGRIAITTDFGFPICNGKEPFPGAGVTVALEASALSTYGFWTGIWYQGNLTQRVTKLSSLSTGSYVSPINLVFPLPPNPPI